MHEEHILCPSPLTRLLTRTYHVQINHTKLVQLVNAKENEPGTLSAATALAVAGSPPAWGASALRLLRQPLRRGSSSPSSPMLSPTRCWSAPCPTSLASSPCSGRSSWLEIFREICDEVIYVNASRCLAVPALVEYDGRGETVGD